MNQQWRLWKIMFAFVVMLSVIAGLFYYGHYHAAPATCSDLARYGIRYGTPEFDEIVRLIRRHLVIVGILLGVPLLLALIGWSGTLWRLAIVERQLEAMNRGITGAS